MSLSNNPLTTDQEVLCDQEFDQDYVDKMEMYNTLTSIAQELQNFHMSAINSIKDFHSKNKIQEQLTFLKRNLKKHKTHVKKLKNDIKLACIIAKTAIGSVDFVKESETLSLTQSETLIVHTENLKQEKREKLENQKLKEKIDNLCYLIDLGYKEIQKIRGETLIDTNETMKLRKIFMCCGQYYADYCNEHQKQKQVEHKNKFLHNKVTILESNLNGLMEEAKNMRYQIIKLKNENNYLRGTKSSNGIGVHSKVNIKNSKSENNLQSCREGENCTKSFIPKNIYNDTTKPMQHLNLDCHLSMVKKLLQQQDCMLKELKGIYKEIGNL